MMTAANHVNNSFTLSGAAQSDSMRGSVRFFFRTKRHTMLMCLCMAGLRVLRISHLRDCIAISRAVVVTAAVPCATRPVPSSSTFVSPYTNREPSTLSLRLRLLRPEVNVQFTQRGHFFWAGHTWPSQLSPAPSSSLTSTWGLFSPVNSVAGHSGTAFQSRPFSPRPFSSA